MGFWDNDCKSEHVRKKAAWERVAFVYDKAAQTQSIMVDGALVKRCTDKTPFLGTATVNLGKWLDGRLWKGKIKNVKLFNKALPLAQIDAMQRMYACVYVCMHACMYICMYVCVYVCMHAHDPFQNFTSMLTLTQACSHSLNHSPSEVHIGIRWQRFLPYWIHSDRQGQVC